MAQSPKPLGHGWTRIHTETSASSCVSRRLIKGSIKSLEEDSTGTVKPLRVSLVEPVAYLKPSYSVVLRTQETYYGFRKGEPIRELRVSPHSRRRKDRPSGQDVVGDQKADSDRNEDGG